METNILQLDPGLHPDIPETVYHAMPEASQSSLRTLLVRSPAHAMEARKQEAKTTPSKRLGSAVHCAVLQPDLFSDHYAVAGQCAAVKKDGSRCANTGARRFGEEWFCNVRGHAPDTGADELGAVLTPEEWNKCMAIRDNAARHKDIQALLRQSSRRELTAVWIDEETGVKCKARFDLPSDDGVLITDVKTTRDASRAAFSAAVYRYGYYFQGAHYCRGAYANGMPAEIFGIIAIENEPPYAVAIYEVEGEALDAGLAEVRTALQEWSSCEVEGEWPAYGQGVTRLSLPPWSWKQIEERVEALEEVAA